ncbi:MAG TPA: IclR family transcriptional regulator, partial [Syntrophorhabdaceae bacterium]|nr:IclR family transcriptional regulator [Syntrophorhabdaceae bacterium]
LGKTIFLGILDNDEVLYVDKREDPRNPISFTSKIGTRRPPYWGLLGPVLMAYLPDSEVKRLLQKSPLTATTKKSITSREEFAKLLALVRERGYEVDMETALEGIGGVAAPIRDFTGKVIAAIGVAFIASSVVSKDLKNMIKEVTAAAFAISREMGYTGETR